MNKYSYRSKKYSSGIFIFLGFKPIHPKLKLKNTLPFTRTQISSQIGYNSKTDDNCSYSQFGFPPELLTDNI
ncbi:hypothetical protein BRARA_H00478 [Brassica rapa]|uniref:Uncharacterized protein n=1 Tax=Brassica campestris TaxID=3711 RepID=A0A397Y8U5_BRACM|nr:hypothetical protein BRARA_H00478 [Brassica rapa]